MRLFVCCLLLVMMLVLLAAAPVTAQQEPPQVIASFSILGDIVGQVGGEAAAVSVLIPVDSDPHIFTPAPRDLVALAQAEVVFVNGANFEEGLLEAIENADGQAQIEVASPCVEVLTFGEVEREQVEESVQTLCQAHQSIIEEAFAASASSNDEGVKRLYELDCTGAADCDPHIWMNPANVALWTLHIRDVLSEIAPQYADVYAANAESYMAQISNLHTELTAIAASIPHEERILVTNHASFNYLASGYGFDVVGTVVPGASTGAETGAAHLAALVETMQAKGVRAIFTDSTADTELAQRAAEETGVRILELYSGSLGKPEGPAGTYIDYMHYNMTTIADGLSR